MENRTPCLQIAKMFEGFRERLRTNVETLDVGERQKVLHQLVQEVFFDDKMITLCHSVPARSLGG